MVQEGTRCGAHLPTCMYLKPISSTFSHHSPFCSLSQGLSVTPGTCQSASLTPSQQLALPPRCLGHLPSIKMDPGRRNSGLHAHVASYFPSPNIIFVLFIFNVIYFIIVIYLQLCLLVFCAGEGTQGLLNAKHALCLRFIPLPPIWPKYYLKKLP